MRDGGAGGVEQALQVEVDHPLPFLGGRVLDRPQEHHAGVVDDDVEPAQLVDRAVDGGDRLLLLGDVGLDRERGVPRSADLGRQALEPLEPAGGDRDLGAEGGELPRGRLADPAAGAGDQRHGSIQ